MLEKVIISGDQQIPYQDKRAMDLYWKVVKRLKPEHIWLVGDHADHAPLGRWVDGGTQEFLNNLPEPYEGDTALRRLFDDSKDVREFYAMHRELSPDASIKNCQGNHDYTRVYKYFDKKMPEVLEHATPNALWGLDDLGIEYIHYEDPPLYAAADFYIHHGVSISKHAGESVKQDMENFGVSLVRGHSHRMAVVNRTYPLRGETLTGIETGHFMDTKSMGAAYDNNHNWQLGFFFGYLENGATNTRDGLRFHPIPIYITPDYTCVVDGKIFRA